MKKVYILLIGIIILASILRLWQIGNVPPSPDWDEAALGYNAYSIMLTGKDEFGKFLPVVLRSFDDYKPALYTYLVIPFIKVFGLNIIAVRLPSVIFGVLTILAVFYLIKELFEERKLKILSKEIPVEAFALLVTFLLAISPWHIQFSRIAFEANVGVAFNVFALLFFIKGIKNPRLLPLSFFFGAINIYVYQSEKVFTVLLFLVLIAVYFRELIKIPKKYIFLSLAVALIIGFPMIQYTLTDKNALLRARGVSVFADQTQFLKRNVEKISADKARGDYLGLILDNRRIEYTKAIFAGYISHFDLNWLFIRGDIARHHAPFMGLLYWWEFPFLFIGLYILIFGNIKKSSKIIIFSYFLLVPIPASITSGVPHAVRALNFLPIPQIFIGLGLLASYLYALKLKSVVRQGLFGLFIIIFIFNFVYYLNQYFVQLNYFNSSDWQYGYREAVKFIDQVGSGYKKVIVSNERPLDQSYMFLLFYLKYPPEKYQNEGGTQSGGFKENHGFANLEFKNIRWNQESKDKTLFIGRQEDFPSDAKVIKTIFLPNGNPAIKIVEG